MTPGLGKGLAALIPTRRPEVAVSSYAPHGQSSGHDVLKIPVDKIDRNPRQPRVDFSESDLQDLAQSIREHGILQPLLVTRAGDRYILIAGERRLRASKRAGLKEVPCLVHDAVTDKERLELAIIENVQRSDLNSIEQALAYKQLADEFGLTHDQIAKIVGKERPSVSNTIRLLDLSDDIQEAVRKNEISFSQAKGLLAAPPERRHEIFEKMMKGKMSVDALERETRKVSVPSHSRHPQKDPQLAAYEDELGRIFGTKVRIKKIGEGGSVIVEYYSNEELGGIVEKIAQLENL